MMYRNARLSTSRITRQYVTARAVTWTPDRAGWSKVGAPLHHRVRQNNTDWASDGEKSTFVSHLAWNESDVFSSKKSKSGLIHVTHLHVNHHLRHPVHGGGRGSWQETVILLMTPSKYRLPLRQPQMCHAIAHWKTWHAMYSLIAQLVLCPNGNTLRWDSIVIRWSFILQCCKSLW